MELHDKFTKRQANYPDIQPHREEDEEPMVTLNICEC